jgi:hypothetical protein
VRTTGTGSFESLEEVVCVSLSLFQPAAGGVLCRFIVAVLEHTDMSERLFSADHVVPTFR